LAKRDPFGSTSKVPLIATGTTGTIDFENNASTFNSLTASAGGGIDVEVNLTTDEGAITFEGDSDNTDTGGVDRRC